MLDRQIKLLSEEWKALLFLMTEMQNKSGQRPSVSKAIGNVIKQQAVQEGYKYEANEQRSD